MKANEFIRFAEAIVSDSNSGPASCRSAISRAYYGAYLQIRDELLGRMGFKKKSGGNEHLWMQYVLGESRVPEAVALSHMLQNLHLHRREADYDTHLKRCETLATALQCVARAQEIERGIAECAKPETFAKIKAGVTVYLKKINSL